MMRQPTNNRNSIASTLIGNPLWVKTPLPIQKLWQSYSVASYIPCPLRGKGLGKSGGALFGKRDGVIRKK